MTKKFTPSSAPLLEDEIIVGGNVPKNVLTDARLKMARKIEKEVKQEQKKKKKP